MEVLTTFVVEMSEPGYYCTIFTLKEIQGAKPVNPKVGERLTANCLFNSVVNGCRVIIEPKAEFLFGGGFEKQLSSER